MSFLFSRMIKIQSFLGFFKKSNDQPYNNLKMYVVHV